MASNKVDLDSVLNAANDYYSLAGGAGAAANAGANNGLAAIVAGTAGQTISLANNGPLDAREFDVTSYAAELLQHTTIRGLYEQDTSLRQEIRSLDGFLQDLVYKNYSKFINATDTIRKMRDNVVDIDGKLQALSTNVDDITQVNQTIAGNLEGHRTKIQEMLVRNAMLQKIKFLVDLPASMERGYREGRYTDVVAEWVKGDAMLSTVLKRHNNVASFTRTQSECRKIAMNVYEKLLAVIRNGGSIGGPAAAANADGNTNATNSPTTPADGKKKGSSAAGVSSPSASAPLDPEDAALLVRLAFADLKALVPTSIFTDADRPQSIEADVVKMQTLQCEALLKANVDVAVQTIVTDLQEATAFEAVVVAPSSSSSPSSSSPPPPSPSAANVPYETAGRKLAAISTDMLQQSLKFSYSKYGASVANLQGMIHASLGASSSPTAHRKDDRMMEEISMKVAATTKTSIVHVVDTLFPAIKAAAIALVKFIIRQQHTITDSHRAASDVARTIQSVCEEAFEGITALLNGLSRGLKQLSIRFLTSGDGSSSNSAHNALCVMIDDAANSVLQGILGTLSKFIENPFTSAANANTAAAAGTSSMHLWIVAHNALIAGYMAKSYVHYTVEGYGTNGSSSSSSSSLLAAAASGGGAVALQSTFASVTKKLVAKFIMLAGEHFSILFQNEYLGMEDPDDIAGPHQTFQLVFRQWMALHTECQAWFPDGQGKISIARGGGGGGGAYRHERSNSVGSNASSQQSARPSISSLAASGRGGGIGGGMFVIPSVANYSASPADNNNGNKEGGGGGSSKFGGGNKRLAIVPSTIDAKHIEEAVILNTLLSLGELLRIVHITRPIFHQLQVDLSFILQQVGPNSSYWLRDDQLFVNLVNAAATSGYGRIVGGDRTALTQGMVEKLARKDD